MNYPISDDKRKRELLHVYLSMNHHSPSSYFGIRPLVSQVVE
jgi:hypothetical protein